MASGSVKKVEQEEEEEDNNDNDEDEDGSETTVSRILALRIQIEYQEHLDVSEDSFSLGIVKKRKRKIFKVLITSCKVAPAFA